MLVDFYILRVLNNMKIDVDKNHLGGQILYRNGDLAKNDVNIKLEFQNRKQFFGLTCCV